MDDNTNIRFNDFREITLDRYTMKKPTNHRVICISQCEDLFVGISINLFTHIRRWSHKSTSIRIAYYSHILVLISHFIMFVIPFRVIE